MNVSQATRGPTRIDSSVAKTQMASATCKLYTTIRDNVKAQMVTILNNLLQVCNAPCVCPWYTAMWGLARTEDSNAGG